MDALTTPGNVRGTELGLAPADDGKLLMTARFHVTEAHSGVLLSPDWLLPLAAWFAGEARSAALGDVPGTLYGRSLDIRGDEAAIIWGTHTWARLDCILPFGTAKVAIGPRGRIFQCTVMLSPEARQDVAAWLRRADAEGWTRRELTA